ncbi:MAG: hypothetical protein JWO06_2386 [Bacteroidota bacterium]|nr:hypothetical protein [Bacteroidota bacterium]
MAATSQKTIIGKEIFFPFIELDFEELKNNRQLIRKVKNREVDGFVTRGVLKPEEVEAVKKELQAIDRSTYYQTPNGTTLPAPFAIIHGNDETLENYYRQLNDFLQQAKRPALKLMMERIQSFFELAGDTFNVGVPINMVKNEPVAAGTVREFFPDKGGLHIHCGNYFQEHHQGFYSLLSPDIILDDQLSYFLVLQESDQGGELTIYDMLWDNVKRKENFFENDYVIDDNDNKIAVKDLRSFEVKPQPGDILVFSGGPIWHRVEDIKGTKPRITFGGFINFTKGNDQLYYWS